MLAIQGSAPTLTAAAGNAPLVDPEQVVLFAHGLSHSTRFERGVSAAVVSLLLAGCC